MSADREVAARLIAWVFGAGRDQVRAIFGADPVVQYWLRARKPPMRRLSVLFQESNGGETCAACGNCCKNGVRWVIQASHILMWPLVTDTPPQTLETGPGECLMLGPHGCTITSDTRPALCTTFTCKPLNAALPPGVFAQIDNLRSPLHRTEWSVLQYLERRYVVANDTHWLSVGAGMCETHQFFAKGPALYLLDTFRMPLGARVQAETPTTRLGPSEVWQSKLTDLPDVSAEDYLAQRKRASAERRSRAASLLAAPNRAPDALAPLYGAIRAEKRALFDAQARYAERYCSKCPVTQSAPRPDAPEFARVRRDNAVLKLATSATPPCMYVHCASGAHLDVRDVPVWRAAGSLPILHDEPASCAVLGPDGCAQEPAMRAPLCDRFLCPREEPGAGDEIRAIARQHRLLFDVAKELLEALDRETDYDGPLSLPEPLL